MAGGRGGAGCKELVLYLVLSFWTEMLADLFVVEILLNVYALD